MSECSWEHCSGHNHKIDIFIIVMLAAKMQIYILKMSCIEIQELILKALKCLPKNCTEDKCTPPLHYTCIQNIHCPVLYNVFLSPRHQQAID